MSRKLLPFAMVAALALPVAAQEGGGEEDLEALLGGFDTPMQSEGRDQTEGVESGFDIGGGLRLGTSFTFAHDRPASGETDWRGLSRFRLELELETRISLGKDWKVIGSGHAFRDLVFDLRGRDDYTLETLEALEDEIELDETFVAGPLGHGFHLKVGRQIVAWGTSETVRVADVLNPLDLREPGLTNIEDLRLPVLATRLDWVGGRWSVSGMAIHEVRFDKSPPWGSDFYPWPVALPEPVEPPSTWVNAEYALWARGAFRGWDLDLYCAEIWNDRPHFEAVPASPWALELRHSRLTMVGGAAAATAGDWLVKTEAAHFDGLEFFAAPEQDFARTDAMVGLEYFGWNDASFTIEAVRRHLHSFDRRLAAAPDLAQRDRFEWALRLSRFLLNQTLSLNWVALVAEADGSGGWLQRFEVRYDVTDRLELLGGVVLYQDGDGPVFAGVGDNDRIFFEASFRF